MLIFECHPFIWWMYFVLGLSLSIFAAIVTILFFRNKLFIPAIIVLCFLPLPVYMLFSLPRKIIVDDNFIHIIWPWKEFHFSRKLIKSIRIKEHRIKSVYIFIRLKNNILSNYVPLRFDWNLQSQDYTPMLELLEKIGEGDESD